jgi:hypothetical protein
LPAERPDDGDCVVCGDDADGIDARTRQPICRKCATIRCDGGAPDHVDDDLADAIASIPHADVESITQLDDGHGHFVIESDPDDQDVDEIDAALNDAGYERNGHLPVPGMTQQNFTPVDESDDVDRGDGVETDGGRIPEGQPIDPLVCPRGHHAVDVDATRFGCETCRANDLEPARWDKSELVDLRSEEPPLADYGDERGRLMADGGVTTYDCPDCGEIEKCNVDDAGQRRCPDCGRAVTAVVTDGGPELVMGRRSRVEECSCGATIVGYLGGDPCPDCGEVIYS